VGIEVPPRNRAERRAAERSSRRRKAGAAHTAGSAALAMSGAWIGASAPSASAATLTVTNLNDSGAGSLRDALGSANNGDTITFQSGLTGTLNLASKLAVADGVAITGPGGGAITISGQDTVKIFYLNAAGTPDITISGLTLVHGHGDHGGAVFEKQAAHVTLDNDIISDNTSTSWGGAVAGNDTGNSMTITNSTLSGNTAGNAGGALYLDESTSVSIDSSTFSNNTGGMTNSGRGGGALYFNTINGPTTISNSTFTGNTGGTSGDGGAMYFDELESLTISNTAVTGNSAGPGGGIYIDEASGDISITGSTISGNTANGNGGGLYVFYHASPVTIQNTTISGNTASEGGGGIWLDEGHGTFTVLDSTISGNTAGDGWGGGMYVSFNYDPIQIVQSTVANNSASADGGAMWFGSPYGLQLTQSTISGNTATNICGIAFYGPQSLSTSVHAQNKQARASKVREKDEGKDAKVHARKVHTRGANAQAYGDVTATGTIISANGSSPCQDFGSNGTGGHVTSDHSLIGVVDDSITVTDSGGTIRSSSPGLGPLQNNGGSTETMALLDGSPAINAGPVPVPSYPTNDFDQRGPDFTRVVNGVVDIGAFEVQPPPPPPPPPPEEVPEAVVIQPNFTG
jgi:parallel beta-helix repeat protein